MRYVVRSMFHLALLALAGSARIAQAQDGAQTKAPAHADESRCG